MSAAGHASEGTLRHVLPGPFALESGAVLPRVEIAYRTWGRLAPDGGNAVMVCHALTGSADLHAWWPAVLGPGRALDPRRDFVICSNVLGGCYGSSGPLSARPHASGRYGPDFPDVGVRDMVRVQAALVEALGVRRLQLVVGGSLGGMQALEWAALHPERVRAVAALAVSGRHSAWCIAFSEAQRRALEADPLWQGGRYDPSRPPAAGLRAARMLAMCSYRSRASFEQRFGRRVAGDGAFAVEAWLHGHGARFVDRFDANTYVKLTRAMDGHDLARGRGAYADVLASIRAPILIVAIDSDVLYPPAEQLELARGLPQAQLAWLRSPHGHDAFLIEGERVDRLLRGFRRRLDAGAGARRSAGSIAGWVKPAAAASRGPRPAPRRPHAAGKAARADSPRTAAARGRPPWPDARAGRDSR